MARHLNHSSDPVAYYHCREFKTRCLEASGEEFQKLFEEIMVCAKPDFKRTRSYGKFGDRKCDGFIEKESIFFQVYSPDELKLAKLRRKIEDDLNGAIKYWGNKLKKWIFVYNVKRGLPSDVALILDKKRNEYPDITIESWSNDYLSKIVLKLDVQDRNKILGICPYLNLLNEEKKTRYPGSTVIQDILDRQLLKFIKVDPWKEAYSEEVSDFLQLLKGRLEGSQAYLDENNWLGIVKIWEPIVVNPYFKVDREYWIDKPFFRVYIHGGYCHLFLAFANLSSQDLSYVSKAFNTLLMVVLAPSYSMAGASYDKLDPQVAKIQNENYTDVLNFAVQWLNYWGTISIHTLVGVPESDVLTLMQSIENRLGEIDFRFDLS